MLLCYTLPRLAPTLQAEWSAQGQVRSINSAAYQKLSSHSLQPLNQTAAASGDCKSSALLLSDLQRNLDTADP